MVVGVVVGTVS